MTTSFDRLRARNAHADARIPGAQNAGGEVVGGPTTAGSLAGVHDSEGKRALFSASSPDPAPPGLGSVTVDCGRCAERTVLSPTSAVRAAVPALVLSVGIGHGDRESTLGLLRRRDGAYLRCPACKHRAWTRLTIRL